MDEYVMIKQIGKGSYGEVWLTKLRTDKKKYVVKKMSLKNASKRENKAAQLEIKLLSSLNHPNIVSYKDSLVLSDSTIYIVMGFCEGGDMYRYIKQRNGNPIEQSVIIEWLIQLTMALQYIHVRNILHRDLKTQNIFLTKSKIIKLGDFGIARVLDGTSEMATTLIGTPYYMSPELFTNKPYNHKSDVWALGCCIYEITSLKHAFNARDMNSLMYKILKGKPPAMPKNYSTELVELMKSMLNYNPDSRPSVSQILNHSYIKKNIEIFLNNTKECANQSKPELTNDVRSSLCISDAKIQHTPVPYKTWVTDEDESLSSEETANNKTYIKTHLDCIEKEKPSMIEQYHDKDKKDNCKKVEVVNQEESYNLKLKCETKKTRPLPVVPSTKIKSSKKNKQHEDQQQYPKTAKYNGMRQSNPQDYDITIQSPPMQYQCNNSARQRRRDRLKRQEKEVETDQFSTRPKSAPASVERNEIQNVKKINQNVEKVKSEEIVQLIEALNCTLNQPDPSEDAKINPNHSEDKDEENSTLTIIQNRVSSLRNDCIKGMGVSVLEKALIILDKFEDDEKQQRILLDLIGKKSFDEFIGKIWQLKICQNLLSKT